MTYSGIILGMLNIRKIKKGFFVFTLIATALISGSFVASLMIFTTPQQVGPAGVTLWFLIVLLFLASIFALALYGKSIWGTRDMSAGFMTRIMRNSLIIAGACVVGLALSSLRTLSLRDAALVGASCGIILLYFYTTERRIEQ